MMSGLGRLMQKADLITRTVAGFVDLLLVIGLARLPDVLGFLSAVGYILVRDGLFDGRSVGKKIIGLRVAGESVPGGMADYRASIIRNAPVAAAYILFLIPYAGWVLGPLALCMEYLIAVGDEQGMRFGDLLARTRVVRPGQAGGEAVRERNRSSASSGEEDEAARAANT